ESAFQPLPEGCALNISYSLHAPCCTASTCASPVPPPSIGAVCGIGYGPGSLSSPYAVKLIGRSGSFADTTMYGMPYAPPPPKSACRKPLPPVALMLEMYVAEFASTGIEEMSSFHGLSDGNIAQPPTVGEPPDETRVLVGAAGVFVGAEVLVAGGRV